MPFVLLVMLALTCLDGTWPPPPGWLGPAGSAALTWAGAAALVGLAALASRRTERRAQQPSPPRRLGAWRRKHLWLTLGLFVAALFAGGWGWTARHALTWGERPVPGIQLVLLSPLLAVLLLGWACTYGVERALHRYAGDTTFPGRGAYVALQARHNLLLLIPALLLITLQQILLSFLPGGATEGLVAALTVGLAVTVVVLIPWILRTVLGLRPLPDGPLRRRLESAARRLRFRCSDILLWETHDSLANAMVTGIVPWLRYVIITDRLAEHMTGPELEAVFGHEVSHVKHRHMLYYMGFIVVSLALGWFGWQALDGSLMPPLKEWMHGAFPDVYRVLAEYGVFEDLLLLGLLCVEIVVLFGFISRRCERQADVDGCRAVSCTDPLCAFHTDDEPLPPNGHGLCPTGIRTFIGALEKVALLNGISRERPGWLSSWQHSTIAKRVRFLERLAADPREESRLHFSVRLIQLGILTGLVAVVLWAAPTL
jgi:STE24 endopeptidase